jgi:hypothetical protein
MEYILSIRITHNNLTVLPIISINQQINNWNRLFEQSKMRIVEINYGAYMQQYIMGTILKN